MLASKQNFLSQGQMIYNGAAHNTYYNYTLTPINNRKRESNETPRKKLLNEKLKPAWNGPNRQPLKARMVSSFEKVKCVKTTA